VVLPYLWIFTSAFSPGQAEAVGRLHDDVDVAWWAEASSRPDGEPVLLQGVLGDLGHPDHPLVNRPRGLAIFGHRYSFWSKSSAS